MVPKDDVMLIEFVFTDESLQKHAQKKIGPIVWGEIDKLTSGSLG